MPSQKVYTFLKRCKLYTIRKYDGGCAAYNAGILHGWIVELLDCFVK